jgi:N-sulfoglucosamine sulfohydrolase
MKKMKKITTFVAAGLLSAVGALAATTQPNILLITVDDMNFDTPGCFGGPKDLTPNIDKLATQGMRFERAHVTLAICQASRQCIMTGRYPHNAGFRWFEPVSAETPILTEILRKQGYLNACFGKSNHIQPKERYCWDESFNQYELRGGRNPDHYRQLCKDFIKRADSAGKPFFLMANSHDPHRPFHGADDEVPYKANFEKLGGTFATPSSVYSADEAIDVGFLPPTPEVKKQVAQYMSTCSRADDTVGEILRALDETGHRDDTLIIFSLGQRIAVSVCQGQCVCERYPHAADCQLAGPGGRRVVGSRRLRQWHRFDADGFGSAGSADSGRNRRTQLPAVA